MTGRMRGDEVHKKKLRRQYGDQEGGCLHKHVTREKRDKRISRERGEACRRFSTRDKRGNKGTKHTTNNRRRKNGGME